MNVSRNPKGATGTHITTAARPPRLINTSSSHQHILVSPTRHHLDQNRIEATQQNALVTEHISTAMPGHDAVLVDAHGASACMLLRKPEHHLCAG